MSARGTILAFGPGTWRPGQVFGSPRYHLWTLAGLGWRVMYVDPPSALRRRTSIWKADDREFLACSPACPVPFGVRRAPRGKIGTLWRDAAASLLLAAGEEQCRRAGWTQTLLWFGAPWHVPLARWSKKRFAGVPSVFHVYDELSLSPALTAARQEMLWQWERELMAEVDLVLCSSQPQFANRWGLSRGGMLVENAIDDALLPENLAPPTAETAALVEKLRALPRPIIAYGGVADHRLDPDIFRRILESPGPASLAVLGKIDPNIDPALRRLLETHPNAHCFGAIPYLAYPHLYREADCLVIGHRITPFTAGMLPEKLGEYLASGTPVVSVPMQEVRRIAAESSHPDAIRIAESQDFAAACTAACADNDPAAREARIALARTRTWSAVGLRLDAALRELCSGE